MFYWLISGHCIVVVSVMFTYMSLFDACSSSDEGLLNEKDERAYLLSSKLLILER